VGLSRQIEPPVRTSTDPWASGLSVALTEKLFDNWTSVDRLGLTAFEVELAHAARLRTRDALILEVASEFLRYSSAQRFLEVRNQQLASLKKQFNTVMSSYRQGLTAKRDFIRFKSLAQRSEIGVLDAQDQLIKSRIALGRFLGAPFGTGQALEFQAVSDQEVQTLLRFEAPPPVLDKTHEFRLSSIQKKVDEKKLTISERQKLPEVSVTGAVNYANSSFVNSTQPFSANSVWSWNATLGVSYNIWDFGIKNRAVAIARRALDIADEQRRKELLATQNRIEDSIQDFERARSSVELSRELLGLEQESHGSMEREYRQGRASYLDLSTSFDNLLDAQLRYYASSFQLLAARLAMHYFNGTIYDTFVAQTPQI
jgi:outer membrane protein